MAEQPIKGTDIIEKDPLANLLQQTDLAIEGLKKMREEGVKTLSAIRATLSVSKFNGSEELKEQQALILQTKNELLKLKLVNEQLTATEIAKNKLFISNNNALKSAISSEQAFEKAVSAEANATKKANNEIEKRNNLFEQAKKLEKDLSDRVQKTTFLINSGTIKDTESGRVRIRTAKLVAEAQRELYNQIVAVETATGRSQRNVGNYKSGFDSLGNSVNQLTREFPAFAVSAQTGFLAISNNLPIFFDELTKINKANAVLISQGKETTSAFKQLGSAVFSVGSILSIAVTLLTLYGKEIVNFVSVLFQAEKALESVTKANEAYAKSVNKITDDITDLKIQIQVQSGLLSKSEGDLLRNENARTKALNDNKELRKNSINDLKKDLGITENILKNFGKTRQVITQGGEVNNISLLSISDTKNVIRYNSEIEKLNTKYKIANDYINEEYNLRGKIRKIEGDDSKQIREKYTKEELIIRRSALDEIRQLHIDNLRDEEQREIQNALFQKDLSIRKIDDANKEEAAKKKIALDNYEQEKNLIYANVKDVRQQKIDLEKLESDYNKEIEKISANNISIQEQNDLALEIQNKFLRERLAIEEKYIKEKQKLIADDFKTTFEARRKIADDNANFEIYNLEKEYEKEKKTIDLLSVNRINNLEQEITAKKILQIQAHADEQKGLTDNEQKKLEIQNKADQEIQKAQQDGVKKQAENEKIVLNQALNTSKKIIDAIAKEEAEKANLIQQGFDKQISAEEKNIETQRRLAEQGKQNTLAESEARKLILERQKEEEKKQEIKRQKALAFFKLFASYAEENPDNALQKALRDTIIAESVAGAFIEGTENVARDLKGNKRHNGQDGYVIAVDGDERILNPYQNKKVGNMTNEALADLAYQARNGLLETAKYTTMPSNDFAKNINDSRLLLQTIALTNKMDGVIKAVENIPGVQLHLNKDGDFIEERAVKLVRTIIKHKSSRSRLT